jgi:Immunity protein Imm1
MLLLWTDLRNYRHEQEHIDPADATRLDDLLNRLHEQARRDGDPAAVQLYAGNHYPQASHYQDGRHVPDDPGDGPQPVLFLTVGTSQSPVYWIDPSGHEHTSQGQPRDAEPEFEYLYGGQESYAPAWQLVPLGQAREAARQFLASDGKRPGNITWRAEQPV